jgi:Na+/proline symporter
MATIVSIGNWAASFIVNDVYAPMRPQADSVELVRVSRSAAGALLVLAFAWGFAIDAKQLERWVLFINSALVVFPLPLAWLKWFWWRTNATGDMVGVLGAFPVGYLVWFGSDSVVPSALRGWIHSAAGRNIDGLVPAFSDLDRYPFWVGFAILFGLGWFSILAGTLLTRPEPMETLKEFYLAARPIGC